MISWEPLRTLYSKLPSIVGSLSSTSRRLLGLSFATVVNALLVCLLLLGLTRAPVQLPAREIQLSVIGGPRMTKSKPIEPKLVPPDTPLTPPPEITVEDDAPSNSITVAPAQGGPGVTVPAEAIGETHTAPALSGDFLGLARKSILCLLLQIAEDGTVKDAAVQTSTGSTELDRIVVAWVRQHWRYRPALRDGTPVAVTTTANVPF